MECHNALHSAVEGLGLKALEVLPRLAQTVAAAAMAGSYAVSNGLVKRSGSGRMTAFDVDAEAPDNVVLSTEVLRARARNRMAASLDRDRAQAVQVRFTPRAMPSEGLAGCRGLWAER